MNIKIIELLRSVNRPGMEGLINYMNQNGFFEAPCSTRYHLAQKGGLAEHTVNVCEAALRIAETFGYGHMRNSIVVAAVLHDLGKMGQYGKQEYIVNYNSNGMQNQTTPYEKNHELLPMEHEVRSVAIASRFIELTEEEQQAILWHNGLYGAFKYGIQGKETPLYMIIHFADMWCSRVIEIKK